jgi:pimeloyl-ACP methyl ester carboxylesterase
MREFMRTTPVRGKQVFAVLTEALVAMACASCSGAKYATPDRMDKGLVLVLPGIEGPSLNTVLISRGLGDLPFAIATYDWRQGRPGVQYGYDTKAARKSAEGVAEHIAKYREEYPGRPVFIVGHSGGGGIAVFSAESMPDGAPVDGVVILEGALGPQYDLTRAIRGSNRHIANCYCWNDLFLWGLTTVGHNVDGSAGRTAGQEGFSLPKNAPKDRILAFACVKEIPWDSSMIKEGNVGGHFGVVAPGYIEAHVAPVISQWAAADSRVVASR